MAVFDATFRGQVSDAAIAALDPDKYAGTIGLAADAPTHATKTHYTGWPTANAGNWQPWGQG